MHGEFVQTFDGVSWSTASLTDRDLYAVACVGNLDGWAAGQNGAVAHTVDGGRSWTWQDAHTMASLRAIRFGTASLGVVAGDAGTLAVTHDAGATWTAISGITSATLRGAAMAADAGSMIAVGDGGVVVRSNDGGSSWSASTIAGAGDLRGVAMDPGAHRVLAVDSLGSIWASSDGGNAFAREWLAPASLEAVAMTDDGASAIAAGAGGTIVEGKASTWRTVPSGTTVDLHAALITETSAPRHYVAGDSGTLLASADQGQTWATVAIPTTAALQALDDL